MLYRRQLGLIFTVLITFCIANKSLAWNRVGHLVISDSACNNLTKIQRNNLDIILSSLIAKLPAEDKQVFNKQPYSLCKLARLSTLPDHWKNSTLQQLVKSLDIKDQVIMQNIDNKKTYDWHYRNKKYDMGRLDEIIEQLILNIKNSKDKDAKALGIIMLSHLLADAHQPLHCISKPINKRLKLLDQGGNLYCLNSLKPATKCSHSLHKYWDNGGGFLVNPRDLKLLANKITAAFTEDSFGDDSKKLNPALWVEESSSFEAFVYKTPAGKMPSKFYQAKTQKISEQRMALASYRLSYLLKQLSE